MTAREFVYTSYIKTTPEKLWAAITTPEFTSQYWAQELVSSWKKGAKWQSLSTGDRSVGITGDVVESQPPKRLVLTWASPADLKDVSKVAFVIEPVGDMVRLDVIHGDFREGSDMPNRVSIGWPRVLSSLKSFLETGKALDTWAGHTMCCDKAADAAA